MLKITTKKRRTKEEIETEKQKMEEEKELVRTFKAIVPQLETKGIRLASVPELVAQNEQFVHYLQSKGAFDAQGKLIS